MSERAMGRPEDALVGTLPGDAAIGAPVVRSDGLLKVTGAARYAADVPVEGVLQAVLVQSSRAPGRIVHIDSRAASGCAGVVAVLTHENAPRVAEESARSPAGRRLSLLQDDRVHYNGQPIALVVAETLERATDAAQRVTVTYDVGAPRVAIEETGTVSMPPVSVGRPPDSRRGDIDRGLAAADVVITRCYTTPLENHNPLEPHATTALWDGDRLTLYDATQGVVANAATVARILGLPRENVRTIARFIGGGFGCKGNVWSHVILAALAARAVARPVRLVLTRRQMFGPVGARPQTRQTLTLGAARDGTLAVVTHDVVAHTSRVEDYLEPSAMQTRMLYSAPNVATTHRVARLDLGTPTYQRAPGEATGTFALESALDELAEELGMDPLELRRRNHADRDPESGLPWSSKSLRECYAAGAERFGWAGRPRLPGTLRDGDTRIGWGMATAVYPTYRSRAAASVRLTAEATGVVSALVRTASQDIGTGTYTILGQIAAESLGWAAAGVRVEIGDSALPPSPMSGGSMSAASAGSAVREACREARRQLTARGVGDASSLAAFLRTCPDSAFEVIADAVPGAETARYSMHAFGAVFVEARVDARLGEIRLPRIVGAYGVGRVLNARTARSQLIGGIVWGVGMALQEHTVVDRRTGRHLNADLAEYHVPVNADIQEVDVIFVDERDPHVNAVGAKGIGEIGITGVAAAIANAVHHATGVRVRDLPITPDRLLPAHPD